MSSTLFGQADSTTGIRGLRRRKDADERTRKIGVLVMSYGTPESMDQIEAYYTHIRRGHPPTPEQLQELTERYEAIVGGVFPLRENTDRQVAALQAKLNREQVTERVRLLSGPEACESVHRRRRTAMAAGRHPQGGRHRAGSALFGNERRRLHPARPEKPPKNTASRMSIRQKLPPPSEVDRSAGRRVARSSASSG